MSPLSLDNAGVRLLTKPERRGRALLLVIFIGWITLELVPVTLKILMHQLNGLPAVGVRICLTIALMYAVWIGWR